MRKDTSDISNCIGRMTSECSRRPGPRKKTCQIVHQYCIAKSLVSCACAKSHSISQSPIIIMVYPKHQAQPESPQKKVKTSNITSSSSPPSSSIDLRSSCRMNMGMAATNLLVTSPSLALAEDNKGINEMMGTCNTMINTQAASINTIKDLEEKYAKSSIVMPNEKFDHAIIKHVKTLEERLERLEGNTRVTTELIAELPKLVGGAGITTSDILGSRIDSLTSRLSSIERLIVRFSGRKRKRVESVRRGSN